MRHYKVNKINHTVFDSSEEVPERITYLREWRDGRIGDWVLTDDGCVIQILREGTMMKPKGKVRQVRYLGTCTGTFIVSEKTKMDASRRINIYSLGQLVKTTRIKTAMKEELKPILEQLGIDEESILRNIFIIAQSSQKDDTKLKALFKLADIMDMEDKNKTQVTQLTGAVFQGFKDNEIKEAERPKEIKG